MDGKLEGFEGNFFSDWEDHVTVAFPEVRLKQYLEMRVQMVAHGIEFVLYLHFGLVFYMMKKV